MPQYNAADSAVRKSLVAVTAAPITAQISEAVSASPHLAATAVSLQQATHARQQDPAAVPALPSQGDLQQETFQSPPAVPAFEPPEHSPVTKTKHTPEEIRKINLLYDKADKITMNFTSNYKIAYSNCQHEIEDEFWKIIKENPFEFFIQDKVDDTKLRETYKSSARSQGVRIY